MWEDPANANGGKWVVLLRSSPHLLDSCWANLAMALVGEILDPENQVCGLVASTRPKVDRIQIWTRIKDDVDAINLIGRRILEAMALEGRDIENLSLEFQVSCAIIWVGTKELTIVQRKHHQSGRRHIPPYRLFQPCRIVRSYTDHSVPPECIDVRAWSDTSPLATSFAQIAALTPLAFVGPNGRFQR